MIKIIKRLERERAKITGIRWGKNWEALLGACVTKWENGKCQELGPPLPSTQPAVSLTVLGGGWSSHAFHLIHELSPGSLAGKESASNAGDPGLILGAGSSPGKWIGYPLQYFGASLEAQTVLNWSAMLETWV